MKIFKCINKTKLIMVWTLVMLGISGLLIFPSQCKSGALGGIWLCINTLVPSLFAFMVLASLISKAEATEKLCHILSPVSQKLLRLSGTALAVIIISFLGGYPVGAKALAELWDSKRLSKRETELLPCICCCAGPGFLYTYVGMSLLGSKESGIILLVSQGVAFVAVCIISRFLLREASLSPPAFSSEAKNSFSIHFVEAVVSAVKATAVMCGFVIFFSVICEITTKCFANLPLVGYFLSAFLEVTNGVNLLKGNVSLDVLAFFTGFGGICVHMQIFNFLKNVEFSKVRFYIFRLLQGVLCLFVSKTLLIFFPVKEQVFSSLKGEPEFCFNTSLAGCCALLLCSVLFLISVNSKSNNNYRRR